MNPYEAPADLDVLGPEPAGEPALASLQQRFTGAMLDRLILYGCSIPGLVAMAVLPPPETFGEPGLHEVTSALLGMGALGMFCISLYQWNLIATVGQSLGKQMVGIRIVKVDGSAVGFANGVVARVWALGFVAGVLNPLILGWVVMLADALFIFRSDRRCLHDLLAGTKVVVHDGSVLVHKDFHPHALDELLED